MTALAALVLTSASLALQAPAASAAQPMTLRVVDQDGTEIPGSEVVVPGYLDPVPTGSDVLLEVGAHSFTIYPGIAGNSGRWSGRLGRTDSVEVTPATTAIDFRWDTETFQIRVTDQEDVEIAGSCVELIGNGWPIYETGSLVTLPITDEGTYGTMFGSQVDGYRLSVFPAIQGRCASPFDRLGRVEYFEVIEGVTEASYRWITTEVLLRVDDQFDVEIPGSGGELVWNGWGPRIDTGTRVTLPITDESIYGTMFGAYLDGFKIDVHPGIQGGYGGAHDRLGRVEFFEVGTEPLLLEYEWRTEDVQIRLVDQASDDIPGSEGEVVWHGWGPGVNTGDVVTLPITEEGLYTTMFGAFVDGYDFRWSPGIQGQTYRWVLGRDDVFEVNRGTTVVELVWETRDVQLRLVDQGGADIVGSEAVLIWNGWGPPIPTGNSVVLPITDESIYATMFGSAVDGYLTRWFPGIAGIRTSWSMFHRIVWVEVDLNTRLDSTEWVQKACTFQLVDSDGNPVDGSALYLPAQPGPWVPGTAYVYPVNDPDYYESFVDGWGWPSGYPIDVRVPGSSEWVEVPTRFLIDGSITPASFEIDDAFYSLSCNRHPSVDAGGPYEVVEGSSVTLAATGSDPEGNDLSYEWDLDGDGVFESAGREVAFSAAALDGPSVFVVTVRASDGALDATATAAVDVLNAPPIVETVTVSKEPVAISDRFAASATFFDAAGATDGPFTCLVDFGDGSAPVAGAIVGETCEAPAYQYGAPGVYTIGFEITDKDGGASEVGLSSFLVVFDPAAGHVTGGGSIDSPAGAYVADPAAEGRATFGFVSRYHKGASVPSGQTQFRFHAGHLAFHSPVQDWLVVTGSSYAMFKGTGYLDSYQSQAYDFMIWAGDGTGPGGADTFRIKIWWEDPNGTEYVIYDNGVDQAITGGNVVVHR